MEHYIDERIALFRPSLIAREKFSPSGSAGRKLVMAFFLPEFQ